MSKVIRSGIKNEHHDEADIIIHENHSSTITVVNEHDDDETFGVSISSVPSQIPQKKKRSHYKQLFRRAWMNNSEFASWLRPVRSDAQKAMCIACRTIMVAEITVIKNHSKGKRHAKNILKLSNDYKVRKYKILIRF